MSSFKRLKDRLRGKSPNPRKRAQRGEPNEPATPVSAKLVQSSKPDTQSKHAVVHRNLWQEAFDQIGEKEQNILSQRSAPAASNKEENQSPTISVVEDVIQTTEKRYQEYQEGGVKIRRSSGKGIDVRGSCQKIINAALSFKDVISAVSAFDPTSHAASAWAVVSLGLTVWYQVMDPIASLEKSD